jgi:hypothetical protein
MVGVDRSLAGSDNVPNGGICAVPERSGLTAGHKILFLSGGGRSGSTLVSMLLAQREDVVNVGELGNLWRDGFSANLLCGCGRTYLDCEFWRAVVEEAFGGFGRVPAEEMRRIWRRIHDNRLMPLILSHTLRGGLLRDYQHYLDTLNALYRAIVKISGKQVVIDASKLAIHGLVLSRLPGVELYVLHWIRDSRAVAFSGQRRKQRFDVIGDTKFLIRRNVLKSAYFWNTSHFFSEVLKATRVPSLTMRYEDFVRDPSGRLRGITDFLGVSPSAEDCLEVAARNLVPSHSILGNPTRFTHTLQIRSDSEWQQKLSRWQKTAVLALTLPLMLRYGYLGKGTRGPA